MRWGAEPPLLIRIHLGTHQCSLQSLLSPTTRGWLTTMAWMLTKSWTTILPPYPIRKNRKRHFESARQLNNEPTWGFKTIASIHSNQPLNVFLMKNNDLTLKVALLYIMRTITSSIYSSHMTHMHLLNQNSGMVVSILFFFMDLSNTWLQMLRTSRTLSTL